MTTPTTAICNEACFLCNIILIVGVVNCQLRNYFKGRGRKMGVVEGGGGGGGVDLALGFKNFWDGVYNFFFCPPLVVHVKINTTCIHTGTNVERTIYPQLWHCHTDELNCTSTGSNRRCTGIIVSHLHAHTVHVHVISRTPLVSSASTRTR